jgi:hypothetical protein
MADLILGWNIMIGYNNILAIPIDRCTNVINQLFERVDGVMQKLYASDK